jgi:DNA-binding LytR/AlgR family response regulator
MAVRPSTRSRILWPDLVFLDAQMPGMTGFDVLQHIAEPHPFAVIFLTAFSEYALQAFEVHAFDYLVKPIDDRRLQRPFGERSTARCTHGATVVSWTPRNLTHVTSSDWRCTTQNGLTC